MATTVINANGTFQLKTGQGSITRLAVVAAGTSWTIQIKDGPDPVSGLSTTVFAAAAFPIAAIANPFAAFQPLQFSKGIQIIMAGGAPAGEIDVDFT